MIRDILLWVSEALFWVLDGQMLVDTHWVIAWLLSGIVLSFLLITITHIISFKYDSMFGIVATLCIFPLMLIILSPLGLQERLMSECEIFETEVASELSGTKILELKQCRYKDNYYGDFGEWNVVGVET
jgi:hypothetical protein